MKKIYFDSSFATIVLIMFLLISFVVIGCGPSKEEIIAMEQARLQAEAREKAEADARRQEEKARITRILAFETSGDEAVQQKQPKKALENYQEVLKNVARYSDQDQRVRQKIIKVARTMPAQPAISEDVVRHMMRGQAKLKMGGTGSYEAASEEMEQATLAAPWWADGYYNLGIVQEKAGKFNEALKNLQLYLLASPQSTDARAVQAKIYEIEVMKEEVDKLLAISGLWRDASQNTQYTVTIDREKIQVKSESFLIQVEKKGRGLEGFINISAYRDYPCDIPGETDPITGSISEDGHSIVFHFMQSTYQKSLSYGCTHLFPLTETCECKGIALSHKEERTIQLVRSNSPGTKQKLK